MPLRLSELAPCEYGRPESDSCDWTEKAPSLELCEWMEADPLLEPSGLGWK